LFDSHAMPDCRQQHARASAGFANGDGLSRNWVRNKIGSDGSKE
jgi:hypothetical protein